MRYKNINDFLFNISKDINNWKEYSRGCSARNEEYKKQIKEKTQFFYTFDDMTKVITDVKSFKQYPFWAISELLSEIFAMNPPLMYKYKPEIIEWAYELRDDKSIEYMYGRRWTEWNQILNVIDILSTRTDSKRAVIDIFTPYDTDPNRSDVPCTTMYMFKIRENKLNMTTFFRSHDLFSGVKYDFILSSFVAQIICMGVNANTGLNIQPGQLSTYEDSLHIYTKINADKITALTSDVEELGDLINNPTKTFDIMYKYDSVKAMFDDLWLILKAEESSYYGNFKMSLHNIEKIQNIAFKDMAKLYYNRNLKFNIEKKHPYDSTIKDGLLKYETKILRW